MMDDAKTSDLLYVSQSAFREVSIFSYPKGQQIGALSGFQEPLGLCSDSEGNVFVVDSEAQHVLEYAHGGTSPIGDFDDVGNYPNGCAVSPRTGDLAVAGGFPPYAGGNVAIYKGGQGPPAVYLDYFAWFYYCTYDQKGNAFASGTDGQQFWLSELPEGGTSLTDITARGINPIASIQWDGQYLAIESPSRSPFGPTTVYQVEVSGSEAAIVNTIKLNTRQDRNPRSGTEFWIHAGKIASPESAHKRIGIWPYPAGGSPSRTIRFDAQGSMTGLTVSIVP